MLSYLLFFICIVATFSRISYCSADATHDHVFAFIATNMNETMECHAFLCPKRKMAQTVTLTVARAFNTAYEAWQLSQADPRIHHPQDKSPSMNQDRIGKTTFLYIYIYIFFIKRKNYQRLVALFSKIEKNWYRIENRMATFDVKSNWKPNSTLFF